MEFSRRSEDNFPFYYGDGNPYNRFQEGIGVDDGIVFKDNQDGRHFLLEILLDEFAMGPTQKLLEEYIEHRKNNKNEPFSPVKMSQISEIVSRAVKRLKTWS